MAQFLLSVWHDEPYGEMDFEDPEIQARVAAVGAFNEELTAAGGWVFAAGLQPLDTATTFRFNGTDVTVTDGPFAEAKEHMGGFWVIDVEDLDTAMDWARKATTACQDVVEVRPMQGG